MFSAAPRSRACCWAAPGPCTPIFLAPASIRNWAMPVFRVAGGQAAAESEQRLSARRLLPNRRRSFSARKRSRRVHCFRSRTAHFSRPPAPQGQPSQAEASKLAEASPRVETPKVAEVSPRVETPKVAEAPRPSKSPKVAEAAKPKENRNQAPVQVASIAPASAPVEVKKSAGNVLSDMAQRAKAAVMSIASADKSAMVEKLWGSAPSHGSLMSYASPTPASPGASDRSSKIRRSAVPRPTIARPPSTTSPPRASPDGTKLERIRGSGSSSTIPAPHVRRCTA